MSQPEQREAFFIGWSNSIDPALGRFLGFAGLALLVILSVVGLGLGRSLDDPADTLLKLGARDPGGGPVRQLEWLGGQTFTGQIVNPGYPVLYVTGDAAHPTGRTLLLSGDGKNGPKLPETTGKMTLKGGLQQRGSLEMLVLEEEAKLVDGVAGEPPLPVKLGKWRAAGEICDGKCVTGAMLPGAGLAHRACANLCLTGELPPVFVTAGAVAGSHYLLLVSANGGRPQLDLLRDLAAVPVELTGEVVRVGNILVFKTDLATARRL
jgi:hypothetical protein